MKVLTLPVKGVYFNQIKSGEKLQEYRLITPFWIKRIRDRDYDIVRITLGYPKKTDTSRIMDFKWNGYSEIDLTHEHFGPDAVKVFAVNVDCRLP